ncbi:hypothetical protein CKAN_01512400 [Cinnamomum micranthum f. kanehirae]|uniref:Pentatricopeptide repeat-containing protein n=1 Tax=Cinnamomum micranthum f. kanehirae TaxID=337451 RepID=A0A3S3N110_9MAGN|nr:hypothetical protein CKAN_01512400 [Cinnamomum micranthum f. kanehirae]
MLALFCERRIWHNSAWEDPPDGFLFRPLYPKWLVFDESPDRESVLWNSMIGVYLKCGLFQTAHDLFEIIPNKNVIRVVS